VTSSAVVETRVGTLASGHPYMRSGHGPTTILYIPGLQMQPGIPSKMELGAFESGYQPYLDAGTFWTVWRPGHTFPTPMDAMAAGYAQVIRHELQGSGGRAVGIIGLSTGGAIAQQLAVDHPGTVSRLVLSLNADHFTEAGLAMNRRAEDLIRRAKWRRVYAMLARALYPKRATRMAALLWLSGPKMIGAPNDPTHVLAELEAEDQHDLGARLGTISCPTLVQGAELDPLYPPERVQALANAIPGARHIQYPGVGHAGPGPKLLADAVAFLTEA
jgi:pimeloyl-ACP methyl ester carboxylesterase